MSLIIFLLLLIVLILIHEFGHFTVAKLAGIKVEEFGIGFPPRLFGIQLGETVYTVNLLFFGGFVRIYGERQGEGKASYRSFSNRSRWTQAAVVVAGIVMNLFFAWILLVGGLMYGLPTSVTPENKSQISNIQVLIVGTLAGSPAAEAGIKEGDILNSVKAGGSPRTGDSDALRAYISAHQNETLTLNVTRAGEHKTFSLKPQAGIVAGSKILGVEFGDVGVLKLSFIEALTRASQYGWEITRDTAIGLFGFFGTLLRGNADFTSVSGPIGIAQAGSGAVSQGWSAALLLTALISINLALINVLPVPGLDGGKLLIIVLEGIRRKPFSEKTIMRITAIGFSALIALMIIVSYHDILRLF